MLSVAFPAVLRPQRPIAPRAAAPPMAWTLRRGKRPEAGRLARGLRVAQANGGAAAARYSVV